MKTSLVRCSSPTPVKNSTPGSCTYGTHYPNRIFAGCLPGKVTASTLADFFRTYGVVLEGKIVLDAHGRSRRFGFVTFASQEGVRNVLAEEKIFIRGKKINVGPAVKIMSPDDVTPPPSPSGSESSLDLSTYNNSPGEQIVTCRPVNEKKDDDEKNNNSTPTTTGNVWTKIESTPKPRPELQLQRQPMRYPVYNIRPAFIPNPGYAEHMTQYQPYHHEQYAVNQPLLKVVPYQPQYLQPLYNVAMPFLA